MNTRQHWAIILSATVIALFTGGCSSTTAPASELTPEERYRQAIVDAMVAEESERSSNLVAIRRDNPDLSWQDINGQAYVLVTTWTAWDTNYTVGQRASAVYDMWVTAVPELRTWWQSKYDGRIDTTLRLEQLLGLAPGRKKTRFLTVWVRPQDLFRPAGDPEIDDAAAGPELQSTVDFDYRTWFNNSIIYSYYPKTSPWTRLGYTYDWNGQYGERGLSEFVVRKGADIVVHSVQPTRELLK
jgi:hypothetical protein